jgi:hypothetical protein
VVWIVSLPHPPSPSPAPTPHLHLHPSLPEAFPKPSARGEREMPDAGAALCPPCSREPSNQLQTVICLGSRCKAVLRVARAHGIDGAAVLQDQCEMWLPVVGFEDEYEASQGRVRSLRTGRILKTPCKRARLPDGRNGRSHLARPHSHGGGIPRFTPSRSDCVALQRRKVRQPDRQCQVGHRGFTLRRCDGSAKRNAAPTFTLPLTGPRQLVQCS